MKLSIITVNLNNFLGLDNTIQSIINQSFNDFEYIVIDGGSTDGSIEIIQKYSNNLAFWISETDNGIYNAMNKGIKKANGDYCLFINSGDYIFHNDTLNNVFKMPFNEDIAYGSINYAENGIMKTVEYPDIEYLTFRHFINSGLPHPCCFIKRNLFNEIGYYDEKYKICSDWKFLLISIFKYGINLKKLPYVISVFDLNGISSQSGSEAIIKFERNEILLHVFPRLLPDYIYLSELETKSQNHIINKLKRAIKRLS